jgi:hypothetical protein
VIASLIREGLFGRGREVRFRDVLHATDVDAWLAFREERSSRSILEPGLVPKVRDLMATGDGEILVVHRAYAGQVIRLGGASET